ncbi:30S ribosomal protein S8 [Candidatus Saccharibacteria bacterium]|nr:30S ribosomal protein S8 [Candidatus Saccharibacteria bacterium]
MGMVSTDPVADMLTRIRNAIAVRKHEVVMPHSNLKEAVAKILKNSNFINDLAVEGKVAGFKSLKLVLNTEDSNARITEIARLSTPGRRVYTSATEIPVVKRGRGIIIVSTSKGMMTGMEAKNQHLGGELICKVY